MYRYKIIVNPTAGKGMAGRLIPDIDKSLKSLGINFEIVSTQYPGHAVELTQQAVSEGFDVVVAAGGDGTVQEVINGLLKDRRNENPKVRMAVLPIGRGNDFAFGMGVPTDFKESCQLLVNGQSHWIDVGCLSRNGSGEERYFGNGIGIGFDTVVGIEAAKLPLTGFLAYLVAALKTAFLYYRAPLIQIDLDGETITQPCLLVSVMNGRRMGGGFWMTPDSQRDDGIFDVAIAEEVNILRIFILISMVMKGAHTNEPDIKMRRSRRVVIKALRGDLPVHADGETVCTDCSQLAMEILPGCLELICNPHQPSP